MNVLLVGSGGREHALAWAIAASPVLTRLYAAPGNAGIADHADIVDLAVSDRNAVAAFCRERRIDLVVIGPEAPLAAGLTDTLADAGIAVFGPSEAAARLEASKIFTKQLCREAGIPTADFAVFTDPASAKDHIRAVDAPIVVKADGLAAGKGVVVASTIEEAEAAVDAVAAGKLDGEGSQILVEDALIGEEISVFALCDGKTALYFGSAQDHKRAFDGDTGPNTGGMGAYSPAAILTNELRERIMAEIIQPTLDAMAARGTPYRGVLYAGLMVTEAGPQLIEYNVRFGDPECQVLMMRLQDDLLLLLKATADGVLANMSVRWREAYALTAVLASKGYPAEYQTGSTIDNLDAVDALSDVMVFHAGTRRADDRIVSNGGRVLNVCALGNTVKEAQHRVYNAIDLLDWRDGFCRRDIGWRAAEREAGQP